MAYENNENQAPQTERPERPERSEAQARRRAPRRRRKVCVFCGKDNEIDYKDAAKLRKYISERGKILPESHHAGRQESQTSGHPAVRRGLKLTETCVRHPIFGMPVFILCGILINTAPNSAQ